MTSDLKSATLITLVSMCILPLTALVASEAMAASKRPLKSYDLRLKSATLITLVSVCILPQTAIFMAPEVMAASKQPQRSYDLIFQISNFDCPGIHVHIASNSHGGLWGQGGLQTSLGSYDLIFEISNLDYTGIYVHIASNSHGGLQGHGGLQTTSKVIIPQIWNQQLEVIELADRNEAPIWQRPTELKFQYPKKLETPS